MQPVLPLHIVARLLLVLLMAAAVYFFSGWRFAADGRFWLPARRW
jgi:hypothetical protein